MREQQEELDRKDKDQKRTEESKNTTEQSMQNKIWRGQNIKEDKKSENRREQNRTGQDDSQDKKRQDSKEHDRLREYILNRQLKVKREKQKSEGEIGKGRTGEGKDRRHQNRAAQDDSQKFRHDSKEHDRFREYIINRQLKVKREQKGKRQGQGQDMKGQEAVYKCRRCPVIHVYVCAASVFYRCEVVRRRATMEELKACHSEQHVQLFGKYIIAGSFSKPFQKKSGLQGKKLPQEGSTWGSL